MKIDLFFRAWRRGNFFAVKEISTVETRSLDAISLDIFIILEENRRDSADSGG